MSQTAPVGWLCCGLQQLKLPLIRKHVLILHQQAVHSQLREELDQLRGERQLSVITTYRHTGVCIVDFRGGSLCEGIQVVVGHLSNPSEQVSAL